MAAMGGPNVVDVGVASAKWPATPLAEIASYATTARAASRSNQTPYERSFVAILGEFVVILGGFGGDRFSFLTHQL